MGTGEDLIIASAISDVGIALRLRVVGAVLEPVGHEKSLYNIVREVLGNLNGNSSHPHAFSNSRQAPKKAPPPHLFLSHLQHLVFSHLAALHEILLRFARSGCE